jgi:hypothetical protein
MARDAYTKTVDPSGESPPLLSLQLKDLWVNTAILGAAEVGQQNQQLSWIWSFGTSNHEDGTWMDDCEYLPIPDIMYA